MDALLITLATALASGDGADGKTPATAADFAMRQAHRLPLVPRFGVRVLTVAFAVHAWVRQRRSFASQSRKKQQEQICQWRQSRLRPCAQFILLCEGLVRLVEYE